jgi:uncharacterized protein YecE (DUF72 family)
MNLSSWKPMEVPPDITHSGLYIGTSGYYYDDWVGRFNPPKKAKPADGVFSEEPNYDQDRLRFYQKYFSFVEINSTFYSEPLLEHFLDIERRSKPSMKYAVKVHRAISHDFTITTETATEAMQRHIYAISPLVETGRFYSFLIQLPDFAYRSQTRLDYLLTVAGEAIRMGIDVHMELRHGSWHETNVLQAFKDSGVGICNTEIPHIKNVFPLKAYATTDKGYIRYSGLNIKDWYPEQKAVSPKEKLAARNARYNYEYSDEELKERLEGQIVLLNKTGNVAVAFNNHYQAKAVMNATKNIKMLKLKLGLK